MELRVLALVLLAALFHSVWNILAKGARNSLVLLWLQLVVNSLWLAPALLLWGEIPEEAWPFLLLSGGLQLLYYLLLAKCYGSGNLSVVYPLTRGSAPVVVCLLSVALGIDVLTPTAFGLLLLILFGIYLVNMPTLSWKSLKAPFVTLREDPSTRLSLLVGVVIALYTLSDKMSTRYTSPLVIFAVITILPALALSPKLARWSLIREECRGGGWVRVLIVAGFTFLAYYLVLVAMGRSQASYVSSIREVSVVFVSLYAVLTGQEKNWQPKLLGAGIIFVGILLLSLQSV